MLVLGRKQSLELADAHFSSDALLKEALFIADWWMGAGSSDYSEF